MFLRGLHWRYWSVELHLTSLQRKSQQTKIPSTDQTWPYMFPFFALDPDQFYPPATNLSCIWVCHFYRWQSPWVHMPVIRPVRWMKQTPSHRNGWATELKKKDLPSSSLTYLLCFLMFLFAHSTSQRGSFLEYIVFTLVYKFTCSLHFEANPSIATVSNMRKCLQTRELWMAI